MSLPTPFHSQTAPLCHSHEWRNWSGYLAASLYERHHEREYWAIRNSAALFDISPLFKYEITGPDALRLVDRIMTRDLRRCRVGQVVYSPWCDEAGKLLDDGTITRLDEQRFRITAAEPHLRWFQDVGYGLQASVRDVSEAVAALALQGPKSGLILQELVTELDVARLPYFGWGWGKINGRSLTISRTGYTGDLGYELWLDPDDAAVIWEAIMTTGRRYNLLPAGLVALDIARLEAGYILNGVDYIPANHAYTDAQKSSPYEAGLGWAVKLDGDNFIGKKALRAERERGPRWTLIGLEIPWMELERLYKPFGLRPDVAGRRASRTPMPLYHEEQQVGQITSHTFSPLLKKYIGLGMVYSDYSQPGQLLHMILPIEYGHKLAHAVVTTTPFFDSARKRAVPDMQ
jgi:aminomethyltransferase